MNESAHERIENELPDLLLARWRRPRLWLHPTFCPLCRAMLRRLELIDRLLRTTPPQRPAHNLTTPRPAGGSHKEELSPPSAPRRKTSSATIQ